MRNKKTCYETLIKNMEIEREGLGWSQEKMAKYLDISLSTYKNIVNGNNQKIDFYILYKLCLLTNRFVFELVDASTDLYDTVRKIKQLSPTQLRFIDSVADFELQFARWEDYGGQENTTVVIPTGDMHDGMIWDSCSMRKVDITPYKAKFRDLIVCGIEITSTHLEPVYVQGDVLLLSKTVLHTGDVGVFVNKTDGRAYIRTFVKGNPSKLVPINDYGMEFEIEDWNNWIIYGKVITKMR